jgi:hypothetical protein
MVGSEARVFSICVVKRNLYMALHDEMQRRMWLVREFGLSRRQA